MAKEKTSKVLKTKRHPAGSLYIKRPSSELYGQLKGAFDAFTKKREKTFKHSERWEHLKEALLDAAERGIRHILVKTTEKEFGEGKNYAEWEIDVFSAEYGLVYCFDGNKWRIYWF